MADSFAFEIVGQVLAKLGTLAIREIGLIWGLESELHRLESTLSAIRAVLLDAADLQVKSQGVRDWLEKLHDVVYDIDDVLDDFITEHQRRRLEIKGSKRKEIINFFSASNPLAFRVNMSHKIKKIRERLDDIAADRRDFQFIERVADSQVLVGYRSREQTHSFVRATDVIGRDHDKDKIVQLLLSSSSSNVSVLPIVGLGGLGKTTLAKLVYNDVRIVQEFNTRIWVCVSEDFDLKNLTEKIVRAANIIIDSPNNANSDLDRLLNGLRNHLNSQRFLLVLDDVWNEDPKRWMDMRDVLDCGSRGSSIIVTTRNKTIAAIMSTFPSWYDLKGISDDKCLSIFLRCAFKEGEEKAHPKLVEIGKEIVRKCGGLPLAVRTLGSLLYTKSEERDWLYIKDNDIWRIAHKENDILPILKLSYDQMPMHLKQCFAYCSVFPKDTVIPREHLIGRWIALGFIHSSDGTHLQLEDIGNQYFNELMSRSFFQDEAVSFDSQVLTCKMHDLVHDLAQSVGAKEFSNLNFDTKVISERVRYLSLGENNIRKTEFPGLLLKLKKLRSFSFSFNVGTISKTFLDALLTAFSCLRVLDLSKSNFEELPSFVGNLKHLRFLDLSENHTIKALPNSICGLLSLHTLDFSFCQQLQDLPRDFGKLWYLTRLYLTSEITHLPEKGLQGLCSLHSLSIKNCYHLESLSMGMRHLTALRALIIISCPKLAHLPESITYLTFLQKLQIEDCEQSNLLEGEGMEGLRSLESLAISRLPSLMKLPSGLQEAAATLKYLSIQDCSSFASFPEWLNNCRSLLKLEVMNCSNVGFLPSGMRQLTALRFLRICGCPSLSKNCLRISTNKYWLSICHIPEILIDNPWTDETNEVAPWTSRSPPFTPPS